jgi:DNA replication protein DnaC
MTTTRKQFEERLRADREAWLAACRPSFLAHLRQNDGADLDKERPASESEQEHWLNTELSLRNRSDFRIENWIETAPPLFYGADLDRLDPEQEREQVFAYCSGKARNLILAGPVGTGKSHVAWGIAHHEVVRGTYVIYASVPRLLLDMRPDGDPNAFGRACKADLLVLDDIGAARPTDWANEQMFSIVEERANHQRRTVVTTNFTWDQLVATWGAPIMDRLRDESMTIILNGDSRRGAA